MARIGDEQFTTDNTDRHYLLFCARRLSCLHCGQAKTWEGNTLAQGRPYDWYFGLPLWLQTPCCGSTLWALNRAHLDFLESYVAAHQRTKVGAASAGKVRNRSMASRLPRWMKSARHRETVLKSLAYLRSLLDEA
jgi:hypothetical protein